MKDLIKNPNFLMVGAGLITFFAVSYMLKKKSESKTEVANEETSSFDYFEPSSEIGGCGCGA